MQNHANCVRSNTLRLHLHRLPPRFTDPPSHHHPRPSPLFPSRPGPALFFSVFPRPCLSSFCLFAVLPHIPRSPFFADHRASASVKNVSTIACRGVCSFIFAEGWNTRLGGAAAPGTQRGMKLRPPYLRLCRVGNEKSPENRC